MDTKLERLIDQCKSPDSDVKIDALAKLQLEFESGTTRIDDPDSLINVLKTCLRTSNQHVTAATLATLVPLFPLLVDRPVQPATLPATSTSTSTSTSSTGPSSMVDIIMLRQLLSAFLPTGGLIERLGDKERIQLKAREALVILGVFASRSASTSTLSLGSRTNKGPETPIALYERFLREAGLASKVWKVREQSVLTLVHIRRQHHTFPIRPYLPLLVDTLEDTDAHVRDCARVSIVELFTGPGVTDAARADLKKEMTKKNVRKTIIDGILAKLLESSVGTNSGAHSREGSESGGDMPRAKEYLPPSLALKSKSTPVSRTVSSGSVREIPRPLSRAAVSSPVPLTPTAETAPEVQAVYVASSRDLETEFAGMAKAFEGKETEHNWADRDRAISRVRGMLKGDVHTRYSDTFLACLKDGFVQWSLKTLASLRTTVATNTCSLYTELAVALGAALDPWCDLIASNLLKMAGLTKKITAQQSQASLGSLITYTSGLPRVFPVLFWQTFQEKTPQARAAVVVHVKQYVEVHGQRLKHNIESAGGLEAMEKIVKRGLADANPAVKEAARQCFWAFNDVWAEQGRIILDALDGAARKQLEKSCPNPAMVPVVTSAPSAATKKSSVAAAIAASRAKAKAIANAPPTLRHQATSASHVTPVRRPGSPSTAPRPASPLRIATSPPSPKSRPISNGARSVSTGNILSRPSAARSTSPPSPESNSYTRRLSSSPLATRPSPNRIRKSIAGPIAPPARNPKRYSQEIVGPGRGSLLFPAGVGNGDESLLLAQTVPIPDGGSESDDLDHSVNLLSFSAVLENRPPPAPRSDSQARSFSPKSIDSKPISVSHALSSDSVADLADAGHPAVEDALRARAEQAESAAERLLELNDPEDEHSSTIPASLLVGSHAVNGSATTTKPKPAPLPLLTPTKTPVGRGSAILRQAALFQDSPAVKSRTVSLLHDTKHESGWWLKRKALLDCPIPRQSPSDQVSRLQDLIAHLVDRSSSVTELKELVFICHASPALEAMSPLSSEHAYPSSPSPFIPPSRSLPGVIDIWEQNKNAEKLFDALLAFLAEEQDEDKIEYGLIVLWEMLENQAAYMEGRESDVYSLLLRVRYRNRTNILEATNALRDVMSTHIEPVYGLTTMHASLRTFGSESPPSGADAAVKAATYAFGLMALGKFILRLPAEVAEDEIPRLRTTLIAALNDSSSLVIRESAAATIISAQLVLRDETHLFALLDGLADEKKNLLTYLFDKHGARGNGLPPAGLDKLEKEMRRLDTRTSTPPRPLPT